jgi:VanZ family protein
LRGLLWLALVLVMALALLPTAGLLTPGLWDKAQHAVAFAVLAGLALLAYPGRSRALLLGLLMAYGVGIELLQSGLPYRDASLADVLANAVGVAVVWLAAAAVRGLPRGARAR